jgi:cytidyltransferase-like protein
MKTVVITSWYFNPIHPWHIECLELCKELWDELWVIVNNDNQAKLKTWKETVFQDENFRLKIVSSLKVVDNVMLSVDQDGSVCESIKEITKRIKEKYWEDTVIYFWKGWDRFSWNIPEVQVCKDLWIEIKDWLWAKTHNSRDYRNK